MLSPLQDLVMTPPPQAVLRESFPDNNKETSPVFSNLFIFLSFAPHLLPEIISLLTGLLPVSLTKL